MAHSYGIRLALIGFATAAAQGALAQADFEACVRSALIAVPVFYLLGLVCGELARRVIEEQVQRQIQERAPQNQTATPGQ